MARRSEINSPDDLSLSPLFHDLDNGDSEGQRGLLSPLRKISLGTNGLRDLEAIPARHHPTETYQRLPSPPYIVVPATIGQQEEPSGVLDEKDMSGFDFLNTVTAGQLTLSSKSDPEWKYERRRQAQQVTPFLYLGPLFVIKDKKFLKEHGITMLYSVRNTRSAFSRYLDPHEVASELGINAETLDFRGDEELVNSFPSAVERINHHLSQGIHGTKKVLVFCETGNECSAAVVIAYLMAMYDLDLIGAFQRVQYHRFCISIGNDLRHLLQAYGTILEATRTVVKASEAISQARKEGLTVRFAHSESSKNASRARKRTLEESTLTDMDIDMSQGDDDDNERFTGRDRVAPFNDNLSS